MGAFLVLVGVIRFGYVTDLLSLPIRYGYLNGIALTVIVSQLPKVFGFSVDTDGLLAETGAFPQGRAERGDGAGRPRDRRDGDRHRARLPPVRSEGAGGARGRGGLDGRGGRLRARGHDLGGRSAPERTPLVHGSPRGGRGPREAGGRPPSVSRSSPSPTRASSHGRSRRAWATMSTPTRRSSPSASPTSRPASSRASRSRAAPPARPSPSPLGRGHSSPGWLAPAPSRCSSSPRPACCGTFPRPRSAAS
jgi:hypothetical protein